MVGPRIKPRTITSVSINSIEYGPFINAMIELPSLTSLSFQVSIATAQIIKFTLLSQLKVLTKLDIGVYHRKQDGPYYEGCIALPCIPTLQHLRMRRIDKPYSHAAKLHLGNIGINHRSIVIDAGFVIESSLPVNPNLKKLHLWSQCGAITSPKSIDCINGAIALQSLVITSHVVTKYHFQQIVKHAATLRSLHIFGRYETVREDQQQQQEDPISDHAILLLTKLTQLQTITLPARITGKAHLYLLYLAILTYLRSIDLSTPFSTDDIPSLMALVKRLPLLEFVFSRPRQTWLDLCDKVSTSYLSECISSSFPYSFSPPAYLTIYRDSNGTDPHNQPHP
jgi:hypothetical protein